MKYKIVITLLIVFNNIFTQNILTPLEKSNYLEITKYSDMVNFIVNIDKSNDLVEAKIIGQTVEKRDMYCLFFSNEKFGTNPKKIKVIIFAQQHGNEPSGKEGALLLVNDLLKKENKYIFDKIDLALIPQVNADGGEKNKRRNGNNADLNRNHLILTEPETIAIHNLFNQYLFDANLDVHEYYPFEDSVAYRRNFDVQVGGSTNINISQKIRDLTNNDYLPYIKKYLNENGYSFNIYSPGGMEENNYIRYSTFDINDGRQSFGILNSFSFIQEGINGIDYSANNIKRRAEGQKTGMMGFIKYLYSNNKKIKRMVAEEREKLIKPKQNEEVAVQLDHFSNGTEMEFHLLSLRSGNDTTFYVKNFRPVVKSLFSVDKPIGYLIHKDSTDLISWIYRYKIEMTNYKPNKNDVVEEYLITKIDSIDFEGDMVINPKCEINKIDPENLENEYYFVPLNQLYGNLISIALEPKSMLGLSTYKNYNNLIKLNDRYPILKVKRK